MSDDKTKQGEGRKEGWSDAAMAGAAVGSAALAAALMYAGMQFARRKPETKPARPEEEGAEATEGPHETD